MGTSQPKSRSVRTTPATAWAAFSWLTVTRTSSEPAWAKARIWLTVAALSAVSVLVIDCTTTGCVAPMRTPLTSQTGVFLRGLGMEIGRACRLPSILAHQRQR